MAHETPAPPAERTTLLYCATVPLSADALLRGQLAYFVGRGYDVHLACAPGPQLAKVAEREGVTVHEVPMVRHVSPLRDLRALFAMILLVRRLQPDIVNAGTPKAGLLGMVAAWLVRTPTRVYVLRGLRLETQTGLARAVSTLTERVACACAHVVVCVSPSLRDRALDAGLTSPGKAVVLGAGSSNGVDVARFAPERVDHSVVRELRAKYHLSEDNPTVGFVGRLTRDKGIVELVAAFELLHAGNPNTRLLLVGGLEGGDPVPMATREAISSHPGIVCTGFVPDATPYYRLMDVLCLPSYREGFPNAPLEAAAAGLPAVVSDATGCRDAVVDGVTGLVVPVGDTAALVRALGELLGDSERARAMGASARHRASTEFASTVVWNALDALYAAALAGARTDLSRG